VDAQIGASPAQVGSGSGDAETGSPSASGVGAQAQGPGVAAQVAGSGGAGSASVAGVAMQEMIDSIRATIEIATRQGATQARIALQPEDLGHISIRLSQTSDGLLARVNADTPAAAQALVEGRSELHQSLSSLGVSLLRLDIGTFGQSQTGERDGRFAGDPGGSGASGTGGENDAVETPEAPGGLEGPAAPSAIAGGELVDVLA